jgi:hypothetical protein
LIEYFLQLFGLRCVLDISGQTIESSIPLLQLRPVATNAIRLEKRLNHRLVLPVYAIAMEPSTQHQ